MVQQQDVRQGHPYFMYDAIMRQPEAMEEMLTKHATSVQPVAAELAREAANIPGRHRHVVARRAGGRALVSQVRRGRAGRRGAPLIRVLRLPPTPELGRWRDRYQPPGHQDILFPGAGNSEEQRGLYRCRHFHGSRSAHRRGRHATANCAAGSVLRHSPSATPPA